MSELSEALKKLESNKTSDPCPVGKLLNEIDEDARNILKRVLESSVSTRSIHNELSKAGYKTARDTIENHRKKWCRCRESIQ